MQIRLTTNIDMAKDEKWPERLDIVPRVGEYVVSRGGCRLQVTDVTYEYGSMATGTVVLVELHVPPIFANLDEWMAFERRRRGGV